MRWYLEGFFDGLALIPRMILRVLFFLVKWD